MYTGVHKNVLKCTQKCTEAYTKMYKGVHKRVLSTTIKTTPHRQFIQCIIYSRAPHHFGRNRHIPHPCEKQEEERDKGGEDRIRIQETDG